jgi:antitoxin component of MazEF toxin-antitoxin module
MHSSNLILGKVLAHDTVTIRTARSGKGAPLIMSLPKEIADAVKFKKGDKVRIYTDGQKVYIDKFEIPEI